MAEREYKPPTSAKNLLERYAAGERNFSGADLTLANFRDANLPDVILARTTLRGADFGGANLRGANLTEADLSPIEHEFTKLASADLTSAILRGTNLTKASLLCTDLAGAQLFDANLTEVILPGTNFAGAHLGWSYLLNIDLTPLCEADPPVVNHHPSYVDQRAIAISIMMRAPRLKEFLQRAGMPEIFVEYMIECARAMDGSLIKKLLQSTFISYGGPDEILARRLYEALHRNGVTTFFFPEHAKPGQRIGRVVRENVESYDRILLLCSKASLDRKGVLYEIEETLERERRGGGAEYLIPIELDDCLREDGAVLRKDLVRVLRDRVCADFRGAHEDEAVFQAGVRKLIAALRPPDLALWRPPGSPKPTDF